MVWLAARIDSGSRFGRAARMNAIGSIAMRLAYGSHAALSSRHGPLRRARRTRLTRARGRRQVVARWALRGLSQRRLGRESHSTARRAPQPAAVWSRLEARGGKFAPAAGPTASG